MCLKYGALQRVLNVDTTAGGIDSTQLCAFPLAISSVAIPAANAVAAASCDKVAGRSRPLTETVKLTCSAAGSCTSSLQRVAAIGTAALWLMGKPVISPAAHRTSTFALWAASSAAERAVGAPSSLFTSQEDGWAGVRLTAMISTSWFIAHCIACEVLLSVYYRGSERGV